MLEIERKRTIGIGFEVVARADRELVRCVGNEPPAFVDLVHGDRPEAVDWRHLALGESQRVFVGTRQLLPGTVDFGIGIDGILLAVCGPTEGGNDGRFI